jgi:hypothetical protein
LQYVEQSSTRTIEALRLSSEAAAVTFVIDQYVQHRLALIAKTFVELSQIAHYVNQRAPTFLAFKHTLFE